ncbi:hypothetical protein CHS0354_037771 [Potamilus streckersoni]|nr:hypothetical protein CHS0354_037771 [Potamilus streckersoni]
MRRVGRFVGVVNDQCNLEEWKGRIESKIKSGAVGIPIRNAVKPHTVESKRDELVRNVHGVFLSVSDLREYQNVMEDLENSDSFGAIETDLGLREKDELHRAMSLRHVSFTDKGTGTGRAEQERHDVVSSANETVSAAEKDVIHVLNDKKTQGISGSQLSETNEGITKNRQHSEEGPVTKILQSLFRTRSKKYQVKESGEKNKQLDERNKDDVKSDEFFDAHDKKIIVEEDLGMVTTTKMSKKDDIDTQTKEIQDVFQGRNVDGTSTDKILDQCGTSKFTDASFLIFKERKKSELEKPMEIEMETKAVASVLKSDENSEENVKTKNMKIEIDASKSLKIKREDRENGKAKTQDSQNNTVVSKKRTQKRGRIDDDAKDLEENMSSDSLNDADLVYWNEGYTHYKLYIEIEKNVRIREIQKKKAKMQQSVKDKLELLTEIEHTAAAYYANPKGKAAKAWRKLREKVQLKTGCQLSDSQTQNRHAVANLQEFRPIFSYLIMLAQLVAIITLCSLSGFAEIGLEPRLQLRHVKTFVGTEDVHKWVYPNIWIGPSEKDLIEKGGMFAPCMRQDYGIQLDYMKKNYSTDNVLGCCEMESRNTAGTTTEEECKNWSRGIAVWQSGVPCGSRKPGNNSVAQILRPCCTDLKGMCELLTHEHCIFLKGVFHQSPAEHCSQVNCLGSVCKMGLDGYGMDRQTWLPKETFQWWRLPLSLLYHHGVIDTVIVLATEFLLMRQIERTVGWLRIALIYILSGVSGLMIASLFDPYQIHVGSPGAVFGMVGVILFELLHFWRLIRKPWVELLKIIAAIVFFLLCGTMPYLDNISLLAGLLTGVLSAMLFLPYITFGRWNSRCRAFLVFSSSCILILYFSAIIYIFMKIQILPSCNYCKYIDCLPYTGRMCNART